MLYMFADDTKLSRALRYVSNAEILQQNIENIAEWSRQWPMDLHPLECKVLKMGMTIAYLHDVLHLTHIGRTNYKLQTKRKIFELQWMLIRLMINIYQID